MITQTQIFLAMSCLNIIIIMVYHVLLTLAILGHRQVVVWDLLLLTPTLIALLEPRVAIPIMATPQPSSTTVQYGKLYLIVQSFFHVLTLSLTMRFLSITCISAQRPMSLLLKLLPNCRRTVCHLMDHSLEIISTTWAISYVSFCWWSSTHV